jgi:hypothetical protein
MSLQPQQHDRSDGDYRQVVHVALLLAGGDPTEPLEPVDGPLHPVTLAVGDLVELRWRGWSDLDGFTARIPRRRRYGRGLGRL